MSARKSTCNDDIGVRAIIEYEVDSIVAKRIILTLGDDGALVRDVQYKVHWTGYPSAEDTWEPVHHLHNCRDSLEDFERSLAVAEFFGQDEVQ